MFKAQPKDVLIKSVKETVIFRFYGDSHWAARACDKERFEEMLKADAPNVYYLSVGDDLNLIPHDDKRFRTTEIDPLFFAQGKSVIDAEVEDYIRVWKKYNIPPERHLGVVEGNHSLKQTSTGMNPIAHFCSVLGFPHLAEYSAIVPVRFHFYKDMKTTANSRELIIKVHHGWGGANARQIGGEINKYITDAKNYDNWDIAMYGHVHGLWAVPIIILDCKGNKYNVEEKINIVGVAGTFLKTLERETVTMKGSTYSERAGFPPRVLSWQDIEVGFHRNRRLDRRMIMFRYPRQVPC